MADAVKQNANTIFSKLFSEFVCEEPYFSGEAFYLPFTYSHITVRGILVYELYNSDKKHFFFDPFRSSPQHCIVNGIDWISMKYIDGCTEFDDFGQYLTEYYSKN
jgi:trehalose/maltose hydrolase-like predicted phosphorylase